MAQPAAFPALILRPNLPIFGMLPLLPSLPSTTALLKLSLLTVFGLIHPPLLSTSPGFPGCGSHIVGFQSDFRTLCDQGMVVSCAPNCRPLLACSCCATKVQCSPHEFKELISVSEPIPLLPHLQEPSRCPLHLFNIFRLWQYA